MQTRDLQSKLVGPLLTLRPLSQSDWAEMFTLASDPEIWAQHPAKDRYREPEFRNFFDSALASGSAFAVCESGSGKICGSSRYHGLDCQRSEVEIGWSFLGVEYWGGVYNRELKALMLKHAFDFVETVLFWVGQDNLRSRRAVEKLGAKLQPGVHRRELSGDSPYVIYQIDREQWRAGQGERSAASSAR